MQSTTSIPICIMFSSLYVYVFERYIRWFSYPSPMSNWLYRPKKRQASFIQSTPPIGEVPIMNFYWIRPIANWIITGTRAESFSQGNINNWYFVSNQMTPKGYHWQSTLLDVNKEMRRETWVWMLILWRSDLEDPTGEYYGEALWHYGNTFETIPCYENLVK